jgi:hypothetical protein
MPLLKGTFAASSGGIPVWNTTAGSIGTVYDIERSSKSFILSASDPDLGSLTYSLLSGSLPTGLSLGSGGIISGTASSVGSDTTSTFTVRVQNATNYADRQFSITIKAQVRTAYSLNAGALQSFSIPSGLSRLNFKSWAGGGGGGTSTTGGSGAYQSGTFTLSSSTSNLSIYVPDGGKYVAGGGTVQYSPGFFPYGTTAHYAPGYAGSGGGGGGAALIDTSNNIYYAITGGGGGGSGTYASGGHGGPGGGDYGLRGYGTTPGEGGGTNVGGKSFFDMYENANLIKNNTFASDTSDWGQYLGVASWQSTGGLFGPQCMKITWPNANDVGGQYTGAQIPITPGVNYSASVWIKCVNGTAPMFIGFEAFNNSSQYTGVNYTDTSNNQRLITNDGIWYKLSISGNFIAGTTWARLIIYKYGATGVANDQVLVDGVAMYEGNQTYLPFFNGSTSNLAPNPSFASDTSSWTAVNGSSGQRITTDYYQGQTACYQLTTGSSDYAGIQAANISITGGNYYALGAYIKNVSGLSTRQMYAQFAWFNSGGGLISYSGGTPITVTDQWTRVICNAVAPSNATMCYIFIQYANGVQAGWVTKIDAITLYNADGQLPYSDGSNAVFSWSGTTNNSSSYMRAGAAQNGSLYYGGNGSNSYTGSSNGGGAGGHGYYGGAGGLAGGAGGGSSWINPTYFISGTRVTSSGTLNTAPNTADSDYASGVAVGGSAASQGGSGRIVIYY